MIQYPSDFFSLLVFPEFLLYKGEVKSLFDYILKIRTVNIKMNLQRQKLWLHPRRWITFFSKNLQEPA